jgi:Dolichyl-phosphate-mannose-protein mannosyltransferase
MSRRPHNPAPPGRPGPVRRDRPPAPDQRSSERPPVWPDVVDTVMLAKFTRRADAQRPDRAEPSAPPDVPGESTRVLRLPGGKHGSGPMRFDTSSRRRTWVSRAVLVAIMCVQAALTLRMSNTAFEDEALYLYSGHLEIAHLLHGAALQGSYASYFSGAPVLYPVLGALADDVGGLAAARTVSLIAMLATTGLLYSLTRRLFNERVGLCAAVIFSVTESALFLGHLATYDAPSLFLLALATWIVVRTASFRWPGYLLAAPPIALAVATKYAAGLFVPTIVALSALAAWPYRGRKALIAPAGLGAVVAALLGGALYLGGPVYLTGVRFTTTARFQGATATSLLLRDSLVWGGLPFALALIGTVAYGIRSRTEAGELIAESAGRAWRFTLGVVLTGTALLAPADQIHIHTLTSLQKHIGFGLFFAAPFAGIGLTRIIGDHFRRAQVGIAIWGAALVIGMTQANDLFDGWPGSSAFVPVLAHYTQPGARYLVEVDEVPIYYLRHHADAQPDQFTSTYFIRYKDRQGQYLTGNAGFVAAIKAGYFKVVAFDGQVTPALDDLLAKTLRADPGYRLAAAIPANGHTVTYYVWVRR